MNNEAVRAGQKARLTVYLAIAMIAIGLTLIAIGSARGQNNDNGGVMPLSVVFLGGGDGVGGVEVYTFPASYHGTAVTVGLVGDVCLIVYNGSLIGPLPMSVLDKLTIGGSDGTGVLPVTVGSSNCWGYTDSNGGVHIDFENESMTGTGVGYGAAYAAFKAAQAAFAEATGDHIVPCGNG